MSEWTCYNCRRVFRSVDEFHERDQVFCPECRAKIALLDAQKEYWEAMKRKIEDNCEP